MVSVLCFWQHVCSRNYPGTTETVLYLWLKLSELQWIRYVCTYRAGWGIWIYWYSTGSIYQRSGKTRVINSGILQTVCISFSPYTGIFSYYYLVPGTRGTNTVYGGAIVCGAATTFCQQVPVVILRYRYNCSLLYRYQVLSSVWVNLGMHFILLVWMYRIANDCGTYRYMRCSWYQYQYHHNVV